MILRRALLATFTSVLTPVSVFATTKKAKEVLAFYYGWYATKAVSGAEAHWHNPGGLHTPQDITYDSSDPSVIARHVTQAKASGITGLIVSWWGKDDPTDRQFAPLLPVAAKAGLKLTVYIENAATPEILAEQVLYLHATYAGSPAWLRLGTRPVIFLYDRVLQTLGLDGWKQARALVEKAAPNALAFIATGNGRTQIDERAPYVDGVHIYDMAYYLAQKHDISWLWRRQFYASWLKKQQGLRVTTATIMPGYDDRQVPGRPAPRPVVDRDGGRLFRNLWQAAIAAAPDWILIVSFNEWHEGSEIEPSRENGDRELATCREMSARFLRPND